MKDASWVHWTGRLSTLLKHKTFVHPDFGERHPRTEPVGDGVILATSSFVAVYPGEWKLPREPVE